MSEIDDGGAAFPSEYYAEQGMTLRDYFAAAALQGLLANGCYGSCDSAANHAYGYADAMIKARKGEA
jgi:diphthamide synthase subunit DPH2